MAKFRTELTDKLTGVTWPKIIPSTKRIDPRAYEVNNSGDPAVNGFYLYAFYCFHF